MKILIIDNNIMKDSWGAGDLVDHAVRVPGACVVVRRGPQEDLPPDFQWDRVMISGSITAATDQSPWVLKLDEWIRKAIDRSVPLLGVCYGHQSICRALGGITSVRKGKEPEFGWTKIETVASSKIFQNLPSTFFSYSSHQDEVSSLPEGFELLAFSDRCAIQAFQMKSRPVFGIQFHPEKSLASGEKALTQRMEEGKPVLKQFKGKDVFRKEVGEKIFSNFLEGSFS